MMTTLSSSCRRYVLIVTVLTGTAGGLAASTVQPISVFKLAPTAELRQQISALGPAVRSDEAGRVAEMAYATAEDLRREYQVVGPPLFHNFLVNTRIRKRGLCFQWAEDLLAHLDMLKLTTLELHWGEARAGTWREHNCVVVTAKGQPFRTGVILDCWRHSGHLYWALLAADQYPWIENRDYARIARANAAAAATDHRVALQTKVELRRN